MQLSLLDTDILSEFLKKKDPLVLQSGADYCPGSQFKWNFFGRFCVMTSALVSTSLSLRFSGTQK